MGSPDSTSVATPLRRDAAENRRRVLAAAQQVFGLQGLDASVDDVARVAGVGMGTVYRRFPTKDVLIAELVRQLLSEVADDARRALEAADGQGLESFLTATARRMACSRGLLPRMWGGEDDQPLVLEIRRLIAELVLDAQRHGQIRDDASPHDVNLVLWSLRGVIETTGSVVPDAWRRHVAIVIAGLRPSATPLSHPPLTSRQLHRVTTKSRDDVDR
jgi:AcrR family transcriptional regulator